MQTRAVSWEIVVASLPLAVLIAAIVFINEFQDMNADARAGKRTLVVRMGLPKASKVYGWIVLSSFVPILIGAASGLMPRTTLIALGALPFAIKAIAVARQKHGSPKEMAPANALTIVCHALTGALLDDRLSHRPLKRARASEQRAPEIHRLPHGPYPLDDLLLVVDDVEDIELLGGDLALLHHDVLFSQSTSPPQ